MQNLMIEISKTEFAKVRRCYELQEKIGAQNVIHIDNINGETYALVQGGHISMFFHRIPENNFYWVNVL